MIKLEGYSKEQHKLKDRAALGVIHLNLFGDKGKESSGKVMRLQK